MVARTQRRGGAVPRGAPKSIVSTKLAPPAPPVGFVPRPRLDERLDEDVDRRVTLVSAHAGTGKTVFLGAWATRRRDVAWLTLDRGDNWSPAFWSGVEQALSRVTSARPGSGDDDPVGRIVRSVAARRSPVVLVLDDLHEIENPIVLRELDALLAQAPPMLRVILATRADPPLRLQRLRLAGNLAEIRASDLAFDADECRELLGSLADDLCDGDVEVLRSRTEGWAAGVRLAALSLGREDDRSRFIAHFAGDERAVADYLLTEILDRQPQERRSFLLDACVPDVLNADLAAALTGNPAAGRLLGELEAENFLVSSHEESGEWFRLHALLRDFLRAQLARTRPDEVRVVNRRCARWYADHGDADSAFRHALAGDDWDLAEELTEGAWHTVMIGVGARPWDAGTAIPDHAIDGRPGLGIRGSAGLLATGDRDAAEGVFNFAISQLDDLPDERRAMLAPMALTLQIELARLDGDYQASKAMSEELLRLPSVGTFDAGRRAATQRAIALTCRGTAELALGNLDEAERDLDESLVIGRTTGADIVTLNSLSELAMLAATKGQLRRAVESGNEAIDFARRRGWAGLHQLTGARLALGWAYFNWDELAAARQHVDDAAAAAQFGADRPGKVGAALLSARLLALEGPEGANKGLRLLRGLRSELEGWRTPVWLAPLLATAEARLLAARGDLDDAREALDRGPDGRPAEEMVMRVRLMLATGETARALDELDASPELVDRLEVAGRIEAGVLEAVASREANDRTRASRAIEGALALAEPNSFRRPFVDGGPVVQGLLVEQIRHGTNHRSLVADLIASFDRRAGSVAITKAELLEPLSEREHAVLRYLPTMMSNAEIASELFVSVNTVKTHLKSVYRKLGTTRRRDAVERARRLDLL